MSIKEKSPQIKLKGGILNNAITTDHGEDTVKMNIVRQDGRYGVAIYEVETAHREEAYFLENKWNEDFNDNNEEDYD